MTHKPYDWLTKIKYEDEVGRTNPAGQPCYNAHDQLQSPNLTIIQWPLLYIFSIFFVGKNTTKHTIYHTINNIQRKRIYTPIYTYVQIYTTRYKVYSPEGMFIVVYGISPCSGNPQVTRMGYFSITETHVQPKGFFSSRFKITSACFFRQRLCSSIVSCCTYNGELVTGHSMR